MTEGVLASPAAGPLPLPPKPGPSGDSTAPGTDAPRRLARLLRAIGGTLLLASASTFLLHRWEQGSDLLRYGVLLGHTVLLVVAGLFCGIRLGESRSARTFLALTLALAPVNAAVLGGLVYSQLPQDALGVLPSGQFVWVAPSMAVALGCVAVSALVLLPLGYFAFRTLAKPRAASLLASFALANALLILPWRNPLVVAPLVLLGTLVIAVGDIRHFARAPAMTTTEGRLARLMLLLPLGLMFARGVHLYPELLLDMGTLLLCCSILCSRFSQPTSRRASRLRGVAIASFAAGWLSVWMYGMDANWLGDSHVLPSLFLPLSVGLVWLSRGVGRGRALARALAAVLVLVACVPNVWLYPGLGTLVTATCLGALVLAYGVWVKSKLLSIGGGLAVAVAVLYQVAGNLELDIVTHWAFLSSLGIALILLASYWEKYQSRLLATLRRWQASTTAWDY